MSAEATRASEYTEREPVLLMAFELGLKTWKVAFGRSFRDKPRVREVAGGDWKSLLLEIRRAKRFWKLPPKTAVVSCYEAGRDGFWLHRFLSSRGVTNHVVDSSSIEVNRRARRAKTDRLDASKLLKMLVRFVSGEPGVWSVVRVPSPEDEDARSLHRELRTLRKERTRSSNRIKGLLMNHGVRLENVSRDFLRWISEVRLWDGSPLPSGVRGRIEREYQRREMAHRQILDLEAEQREAIRSRSGESLDKIRQLSRLRGIGAGSSWLYVMEFFGWRQFKNRREVGGLAGLTSTPYQSGDEDQDRGISKAGNRYVRAVSVQIAWGWLRYQPHSALTRWYQRRFGAGGSRLRKIGIVALARKILVALWQFLEFGAIPEGAELKA
jgi:transposase